MENKSESISAESQFIEWMNSLMSWEKPFYLNKIALACDMSYQGVYKWAIGKSKIKKPFQSIINQVAGKEVIKLEVS